MLCRIFARSYLLPAARGENDWRRGSAASPQGRTAAFMLYILSGLFCSFKGRTPWLLSGILSLPWSPLASLPPEVDVPLPLGLALVELPVVGAVPGVAELAAGSPVAEPRPLGAPPWAFAWVPEIASTAASANIVDFMVVPPGPTTIIRCREPGSWRIAAAKLPGPRPPCRFRG